MYAVNVGEYYIKRVEDCNLVNGYAGTVILSKEIMRGFSRTWANSLAKELNGKVVEIKEETTCENYTLNTQDTKR